MPLGFSEFFMEEVHCVYCGNKNQVRVKSDGSSLRDCTGCGANPLPFDSLLIELELGDDEFRVCSKCNCKNSMINYCWKCGTKL